jgi:dihydrofolate synthase/folylpolyglutamate synthase
MTAMAFLQFQRKQVEAAVIEVGMGGRLDATNVVQPHVTVITSIGLDHCAELGSTHAAIAREKAGIIKPGVPVVIGLLPAEAEEVVREVAASNNAPVLSVRERFGRGGRDFPVTNLEGEYQRWNAATTEMVVGLLPGSLRPSADAIAYGLGHVNWPGRWQRTSIGGKKLILDASHNPEGASMLERNFERLVAETGRKPVVVVGALGEFRARALLAVVARYAREIYVVAPRQTRATPFEEMKALVPEEHRHLARRATVESIFPDAATCSIGGPDDTIVVTGSIYLLGEVLERIEPGRGAGEGRLQDF